MWYGFPLSLHKIIQILIILYKIKHSVGTFSCYNALINVIDSNSVSFISDGVMAAKNTILYGFKVKQDLNISCQGAQSCLDTIVHAGGMSGALSLDCSENSCHQTYVDAADMIVRYRLFLYPYIL